jgi:hypothetical protein
MHSCHEIRDNYAVEPQAKFTICFDFPELEGEPQFAGWYKGTPGFAPSLASAMLFDDEETAERFLNGSYAAETAECGRVVEVGS